MAWLHHFAAMLSAESQTWHKDTFLMVDNAAIHGAAEVMYCMSQHSMQTIFTSPYSYSSSPAEKLFSALKRGELNPHDVPTGKR